MLFKVIWIALRDALREAFEVLTKHWRCQDCKLVNQTEDTHCWECGQPRRKGFPFSPDDKLSQEEKFKVNRGSW